MQITIDVPDVLAEEVTALAARMRSSMEAATMQPGRKHVDLALSTMNAPRPRWIDVETFVRCLYALEPDKTWLPHMQAFFEEVSMGAIHDIVLAGIVDFETLYRAARIWGVVEITWMEGYGSVVPWIREMADLKIESSRS